MAFRFPESLARNLSWAHADFTISMEASLVVFLGLPGHVTNIIERFAAFAVGRQRPSVHRYYVNMFFQYAKEDPANAKNKHAISIIL